MIDGESLKEIILRYLIMSILYIVTIILENKKSKTTTAMLQKCIVQKISKKYFAEFYKNIFLYICCSHPKNILNIVLFLLSNHSIITTLNIHQK